MTRAPDHADDDLEIVDSGHEASTDHTDEGTEELWAVVENSGEADAITVELQLRDEYDALATHERTNEVDAGATERYRFVVTIPADFDQYVFSIADGEDEE